MAALLNNLFAEDLVDHDALADHGDNVDALRAFVAEYTAEAVAPVVGLEAEVIRELARDVSKAERAAFYMSTGVNMGRRGSVA